MQNPSGHHSATPAPAATPSKSKSSAQNPSGHHPATPSPSATPSKSKSSAQAATAGQASSSSHHHSGGGADASASTLKRKRGMFQKDLQHMMYGFGDDPNPLPETVALVEDIVVEYVTDLVHKAQNVASKRGKLLTEDFLYLIRKDMRKLHRATELLSMNEELKQARKAFDVDEETLATNNA
ncbi:transcription initiation factor TFIID subunit 13-like [Phragmites australis]|uniref:transcription initiation factor TFIID subunit 13-like n=1 Tax=Phragmites australis TaxID=29695 RepID=UPI002D76E33E|nr:transcription initiation factor TFIID subunit 13-like [Phragmites australis]